MNFLPKLDRYPPNKGEPSPQQEFEKPEHIHHMNHAKLDDIWSELKQLREEFAQQRDPVYSWVEVQTNAQSQLLTQPWVVDYKNRKHLFATIGASAPVVFLTPDGFQMTLNPGAWTSVGFDSGTVLVPNTATVNANVLTKATDELLQ